MQKSGNKTFCPFDVELGPQNCSVKYADVHMVANYWHDKNAAVGGEKLVYEVMRRPSLPTLRWLVVGWSRCLPHDILYTPHVCFARYSCQATSVCTF